MCALHIIYVYNIFIICYGSVPLRNDVGNLIRTSHNLNSRRPRCILPDYSTLRDRQLSITLLWRWYYKIICISMYTFSGGPNLLYMQHTHTVSFSAATESVLRIQSNHTFVLQTCYHENSWNQWYLTSGFPSFYTALKNSLSA